MVDCTIVILTFKGLSYLEELLPTLSQAINNSTSFKFSVIVLDNGPDDGSLSFVHSFNPSFHFVRAPKNDYVFSYNDLLAGIDSPFTFLCDNDTRLHPDLFNKALPIIMNDEKLFAVSLATMDWEGRNIMNGPRSVRFQKGWVYDYFNKPDESLRYTLYGGGGSSIVRTKIFRDLDGFDTLFRPAYAEDKDLGHRAWKKGYRILYLPSAIIYHKGGGTHKRDKSQIERYEQMILLNNMKWMLKDIDVPGFLFWFILFYPYRLLVHLFQDPNLFISMIRFLGYIPAVIKARMKLQRPVISDLELAQKFNQPYNKPNFKET